MNRRLFTGSLLAASAALLNAKHALAQRTGQVVGNDAQIVATGNVFASQSAGGIQSVTAIYDDNGTYLGYSTGQAVYNEGQIVSTGDVYLDQSAAGRQEVYVQQGSVGVCTPGEITSDGLYCDVDGCWQLFPCFCAQPVRRGCKRGRCQS
jgi:hypothetical protein